MRPRGEWLVPRSEWLVLVAAALIAWPIWTFRGAGYRVGDTIDASITLITSDREDLSCALNKSFGKYRCEYSAPNHAWATPPTRDDQLLPCYTVNRQLLLVPGLFQQPALVTRYTQEPPARITRRRLRRFVARCKLRLVEEVTGVQVRWVRGASWGAVPTGWVAEPVSCQVANE